jgi:hypothetical protein
MIPILMHQMRILTIYVSSVMLMREIFGNPKCYYCKNSETKLIECRKMKPNPSKDRAMMREIVLK